jgi:hypothetical protein
LLPDGVDDTVRCGEGPMMSGRWQLIKRFLDIAGLAHGFIVGKHRTGCHSGEVSIRDNLSMKSSDL